MQVKSLSCAHHVIDLLYRRSSEPVDFVYLVSHAHAATVETTEVNILINILKL